MTTAIVHVPKPKPPNRLAVLPELAFYIGLAAAGLLGWCAHDWYEPPGPRFYFQPVVADSSQNDTWSTRYVLGNIAETQFKDRRKGECTVYYQQITACEKGGR